MNKLVMDGEYTSVYQWHFEKLGCKMTSKLTFCVGFLQIFVRRQEQVVKKTHFSV